MIFWLFLAFTLTSITELYLLIEVGSVIGSINTLALIILTGLVGATLAKMQGAQTMLRVRTSLVEGRMPAEELIDAVLILMAGVVLLTPGFITDILGLLILLPFTRFYFKRFLRKRFDHWMQHNTVQFRYFN